MKVADLEQIVRGTPRTVAVFRVKKVPTWAERHISVGDEVYWCEQHGSIRTMRAPKGYNDTVILGLGASYIEFIDYMRVDK